LAILGKAGIHNTTPAKIIVVIVAILIQGVLPLFGHAAILLSLRYLSFLFAPLFIAMTIIVAPKVHLANVSHGGSFGTVLIALAITISAGGLSFANIGSDYSRYLPQNASRSKIALYTALGAFLPATILNAAGAIIGTKLNAFDPVGSLAGVMPHWFHFLFLLIAIVSMIWANIINTYSSGLNLQAIGIRIQRYKTVLLDAVVAAAFVAYALWISNFVTSLVNFLALMIWWIAPWTAIYLVDMWLRRYRYASADLLSRAGGTYWYTDGFNWRALAALVLGAGGAVLFTNATLFASPLTTGPLGGMDLSIPVGMIVGGLAYYLLAGNLRVGVPAPATAATAGR